MQINEKNIEKIIDISELTKLMQFLAKNHEKKGGWDRVRLAPKFLSESTQYYNFLHITNSTISFFHLNTTIKYNYF